MAINTWRTRTVSAAVALTAAVTALSLTGSAAFAAGYASSAGPWSAAASLTGTDGQQSLIDVKVAGDGTAFALWRNKAAGESTWDFQIVVRAAGSSTWGAAHTLATGRGKSSTAALVTAADGSATVAWLDGSSSDGDLGIQAAAWDPASAAWSDPTPITTTTGSLLSAPSLAAAADGTLTAVWQQGDGLYSQVMTATRAAGTGTWSASRALDSLSSDYIYDLGVAVAPDGAATAVWDRYSIFTSEYAVNTATRASAAGDWSSAAVLTGTDTTSSNVRVAMDGSDATTVTWETNAGGNAGSGDLKSVTRNSPSGDWGTAQTAVSSIADSDDSGPLTGPNGDVTYVWAGWSASAGTPVVRAVTRSASTGAWSSAKVLSTGYVKWKVSASVGADGTVQVLWPQTPSIDNGNDIYLGWAVRTNGSWSKATTLSSTPVAYIDATDALTGEVAAGPDGRATAVWTEAVSATSGGWTSQVRTQSQTLLAKPVITTAAALTGTARTGRTLTCKAAWSGTGAAASYIWKRDGKTISGATARTRTLTAADYTHKLACKVTVSNGAGSVSSTSASVTVAVGAALKATTAPSVSGSAKVGGKLTAAHGTWSPAATSYTYVWKRAGKAITGATRSTYTVVKADKGKKITVTVTAHRTGYTNGSATTPAVTGR